MQGEEAVDRRWRWWPLLPATGLCPACHARIGPYPLAAEPPAAIVLARGCPRLVPLGAGGALTWLTLVAVPLAFTDIAVHRLPDRLTATAFTGTVALLTMAALTGHQPGRLARAALACFYLALCLIRPEEMGVGAKLAASLGLVLGWTNRQALITGTFLGLALAAISGGALIAAHRAGRTSQLPLGQFMLAGALAAIVLLRLALTEADDHAAR